MQNDYNYNKLMAKFFEIIQVQQLRFLHALNMKTGVMLSPGL